MAKQFVSFDRLAQYDKLIKEFIKGELASVVSEDVTTLKDAINVLNGTEEGSVKKQIEDALAAFIATESSDNVVNTYKEVLAYIQNHGEDFSALVGEVEGLKELVGTPATETEEATGLYKELFNSLEDKEINAVSGVDEAIVASLGGTISSPTIALEYELCTEDDIDELFATKHVMVNGKEFSSVAKALANMEQGDTVTLIKDLSLDTIGAVTVTGEATLDLNGKTVNTSVPQAIYVTDSSNARSISMNELTITGNGVVAGPQGEVGKSYDGKSIATVAGVNSKLVVLDGTFTSGGVGSDGMYGVYAMDGASVVLGDEATHTGPTITSWFAAVGENNTTAPANVKIYGGTYTALANPENGEWWSYFCAPVYASAAGTIDIYGGTFNGYYGLSSRYSNVEQTINIYGGRFNGSKAALFVDNQKGSYKPDGTRVINIYGGVFSSDVSEFCAEDYVCVEQEDGTFVVIPE